MTLLNDVVESYNEYAEWVFDGRTNEDLGEDLRRNLISSLQLFCFTGDEVDEANVEFANSNSSLGIEIVGNSIRLQIPNSEDEDDEIPLIVSGG